MILSIDVESRAATDLIKSGAHAYWECEHADVLCAAWRFDGGEAGSWVRGDPVPPAVAAHIVNGGTVSAYNANFERLAFRHVLGPRYGWPVPTLEQWDDTAAMAAAMGLPRALGMAAKAMGLEVEKDDAGKRLIRKFSIPRKARKGEVPGRLYWNEPWNFPEEFEDFVRYCEQDVVVERALREVLVPLSEAETEVWRFDARMNDRGIRLDRELVEAMLKIVEQAKGRLDKAMAEATGWEVTAASQVSALTAWLVSRGVPAESLAKDLLDELLGLDDIPADARAALEIRKEAAKASTAKLSKMLMQVQRDDRLRGQVLYHGAATGRWSGKGVQVQNLPRGSGVVKNPDTAAPHMLCASADMVDLLYGQPMSAVSDMLRACLTASPGRRLIAADYSSIEGRGTAWLAGEAWKIDAFNAADAKAGPGIYELTASKIYGVKVDDVNKGQRQVGKTAELGLGYQGGVMAFHSMARIYGVDMAQAYEPLRRVADGETWERALERYEECCERQDTGTDILTQEAWIASEVTKVMWRAEHPATVALWHGLEDAARDATLNPGSVQTYGRIAFTVRKNFLWMRLPSGRCIAYGAPRVKDEETPWGGTRKAVTALGVNSTTNKWERHGLYGGILTNNCLSGDTEVLTNCGWLRIDMVDSRHTLWDGEAWVSHNGRVFQGRKATIDFGGVRMTPDHKVWTGEWKRADETSPQSARLAWENLRTPDRDRLRRLGRSKIPLDGEVHLRNDQGLGGGRVDKRQDFELRVPATRASLSTNADARYDPAPSLHSLAEYARALPKAWRSGLEKLWRTRHNSLRSLAAVRELLGRYGAFLPAWVDPRQAGQQQRVFAGELCLADTQGAGAQPTRQPYYRHSEGRDAALRSSGPDWDKPHDTSLPLEARLAGGTDVRHPGPRPESDGLEPVYDLLNAGPRHRFTVRPPGGGEPFIVSNCVQGLARDLMANGMLNADRAGYPIVLTVHDEAVADVEEGFGSLAEFERLLCEKPDWAKGLPLVADGWEGHRYRK